MKKLDLDFALSFRLGRFMSHDSDTRRELIRRLFCLVTIAAEDAAALAIEGQASGFGWDQGKDSAIRLRELGERIEILSSAIMELKRDFA